MKATLLALVALASGIGVGLAATWWEFADERLPTESVTARETSHQPGKLQGPLAVIVDGETYDFGKMNRYASQTHEFVVRNDGDSDLTLVKGDTTCKCTQFELERDLIPPGETGKIILKWEAKTSESDFSQSAELTTNDPKRKKVKLVVAGRVIDAARPERPELMVNTISANEDATVQLKLFNYRSEPMEIEKVELTNEELAKFYEIRFEPLTTADVAAEPDAQSGLLMLVTIKSGLPLGAITQTIRLTTNNPALTPFEIPIVGKMVSDISLVGPRLDGDLALLTLGTVERAVGTKVTIFVLVKGPHREETEVKVASVDPESNLKATLELVNTSEKIKRYSLHVEVPPNSPSTNRLAEGSRGKIVLESTHPLVKQVVVNVRFAVKD